VVELDVLSRWIYREFRPEHIDVVE
jgi:hypothetical protein